MQRSLPHYKENWGSLDSKSIKNRDFSLFKVNINIKAGVSDGGKYVCFDDTELWSGKERCLVYSFGISNDWSFEDQLAGLGCTIYAFDPSIEHSSSRGKSIRFTRAGLAGRNTALQEGGRAFTLETIIAGNNHSHNIINYLKVDIEGYELDALEQWLESGLNDNFI